VTLYIDITTPPFWDGPVLRAVDLDLDVVRGVDGRVWIEDEDEFAEHRVELGYPDDVASAAEKSCARVHAAVLRAEAPYDGSHEPWLAAMTQLSARS
jgi:protein associated with RNAse G/E